MPCVILAISVAQREGIIIMSKLSFVALSLQTTHLDPASVSKVSYVKLVDGNITRQDDVPIIPPTSKKRIPDEQTEKSLLPWDEALEKLGMMIGKLPIVSYYRDADKEIFHAASRYLNIELLRLHWLDCRELARHLLPELPDVQLSTVLKTLDLYEDYADSSAVEQTTQIVIELAQRQGATTVAQLWDELYDHPEDFLGLDSTFEGAANSGSSTDDDEAVDAPLAAEALPLAEVAGGSSHSPEDQQPIAPVSSDADLPAATVAEETPDEPVIAQEPLTSRESGEASDTTDAPVASPDEETAADVDQSVVGPPAAASDEMPVFLQEPTQDERTDWQPEPTPVEGTPQHVPELATGSTPIEDPDTDEDPVETAETVTDHDQESAAAPESDDAVFREAVQRSHTNTNHVQSLTLEPSSDQTAPVEEEPLANPETDAATALSEADEQPAFLKEPTVEELEAQDVEPTETEPTAAEQSEQIAMASEERPPDEPQELSDHAEAPSTTASATSPTPLVAPPMSPRREAADASPSETHTVQAIKVSERPRVEEPTARTSNVNQIFGFVGLFLFGVLTIIGVVLVVMAVMLFFTENSLMLETKIAGVILTLAIALLSLLMTNVSYRSFRKK